MDRQKYLAGKRWGIFSHYLANQAGKPIESVVNAEEWNQKVNGFDVQKLARQVKETGADYFCITIGQNSGNYCSPNQIYDFLTEITPSRCSSRDLVAELADELEKYELDMWVYLPSGAPNADARAVEKLEWEDGKWGGPSEENSCKRLAEFQRKWESIIREWSMRWGEKIKGWWIDGCYFAKDMYSHQEAPNFESFADALRSGNENAVICFNQGIEKAFTLQGKVDDFTAGETDQFLPLVFAGTAAKEDINKNLNGKKLHILSYLGEDWGYGETRFPDELAVGYTKYVLEHDGIITWDVRLDEDGGIPECFMRQLSEIGKAVGTESGK